jgi:hypothetical protein
MIFTWLFSIPAYLIQAVIDILPNGGAINTEWVNGVYTIWADINAFSFIVPVSTLLSVLAIALTFHLTILGFKLFHWIITKIPFIG